MSGDEKLGLECQTTNGSTKVHVYYMFTVCACIRACVQSGDISIHGWMDLLDRPNMYCGVVGKRQSSGDSDQFTPLSYQGHTSNFTLCRSVVLLATPSRLQSM